MRKSNIIFCLVAAGVIMMACEKKGEGETKDTAQKDTVQVSKDSATFSVDTAQSTVKWSGKKVTGKHNGKIKIQSGELKTLGNTLVGGTIVIDMNTITDEDLSEKDGKGKLEGHLKSPDFFDVAKYPTATFVITNVQPGSDGKEIVNGKLTLKGKTEDISINSENIADGDKAKAKGTAVLDRTKWDVRYGSGKFFPGIGDKMIYDEMELEFEIVANKK